MECSGLVTIQVHFPNETKVVPTRIAYLAERATKILSVLHFLLDSTFLLCYLFEHAKSHGHTGAKDNSRRYLPYQEITGRPPLLESY